MEFHVKFEGNEKIVLIGSLIIIMALLYVIAFEERPIDLYLDNDDIQQLCPERYEVSEQVQRQGSGESLAQDEQSDE